MNLSETLYKKEVLMKGLYLALVLSALMLSGCASAFMTAGGPIDATTEYAVVNFMRPSSFGGAVKFGVWDSESLVGILTPKNYIPYAAKPGEHIFLVKAENWDVIKADVTAGKVYHVLCAPQIGVFKTRVRTEVIKPGDERLGDWMAAMTPSKVLEGKRSDYVDKWRETVDQAIKNVNAGKDTFIEMKPGDGR